MKIVGDEVIFDTGKIKSANCGIIGIGHGNSVSEGYDDGFFEPMQEWEDPEEYEGLTTVEQIELADYMINRWKQFKKSAYNT